MKVVQVTRECNFEQRASVCSKINKEVEQNVGDRNKAINSFSSTDR